MAPNAAIRSRILNNKVVSKSYRTLGWGLSEGGLLGARVRRAGPERCPGGAARCRRF